MALATFRNTETGEIVALDEGWPERWPDDPFEPYEGDAPIGAFVGAPAEQPAATQKSGTPTQQQAADGDRSRF